MNINRDRGTAHDSIHVFITGRSTHVINYRIALPRRLRRYFYSNEFSIWFFDDVSSIPESIALIPITGYLLPVAIASGTDITVNEIDSDFYKSAIRLNFIMRKIFPNFRGSKIIYTKLKQHSIGTSNIAQLFSGGLDSTALYYYLVKVLKVKPTLISVVGSDLRHDDRKLRRKFLHLTTSFARKEKTMVKYILFDFISKTNVGLLGLDFIGDLDWWGVVACSTALTSITAPTIASSGIRKLYVASGTHKGIYKYVQGADHYVLYNAISFAGCKVVSGLVDFTRIERAGLISRLARDEIMRGHVNIRVCLSPPRSGFFNCGICEKCLRTALELITYDVDPHTVGFPLSKQDYITLLRSRRVVIPVGHELYIDIWNDLTDVISRYGLKIKVFREEPKNLITTRLRTIALSLPLLRFIHLNRSVLSGKLRLGKFFAKNRNYILHRRKR